MASAVTEEPMHVVGPSEATQVAGPYAATQVGGKSAVNQVAGPSAANQVAGPSAAVDTNVSHHGLGAELYISLTQSSSCQVATRERHCCRPAVCSVMVPHVRPHSFISFSTVHLHASFG